MSDSDLSSKQRKYLRGLAHHLKPVVQVGGKGLTEAVLAQIDVQLTAHELIKTKLGQDCPVTKPDAAAEIEKALGARIVQTMGRTITIYRARQKTPTIHLP